MPSASELLTRLRDPSDDGPSARLAALVVDDVLATPVARLVEPGLVVAAVRDSLRAWTSSDAAAASVVQRLEVARAWLSGHDGAVGDRVPTALRDGARTFVQLPMPARREAVLRLLDRPGVKQVIRAQLAQTLADFGRRAASPVSDNALARGLGGLGKLAGQIARPSPLGAIASAVSGEVERQVEKRASEFADTAVAGVLAGIAEQASDPARATQQAALRLELLDGLLALTGSDVAELARGASPPRWPRSGRHSRRGSPRPISLARSSSRSPGSWRSRGSVPSACSSTISRSGTRSASTRARWCMPVSRVSW